jgi:hypothetical protein
LTTCACLAAMLLLVVPLLTLEADARGGGANDGVDTRALQHYLGHRNIMHTVRYTELRSDRFDGFWKD